MGGVCEAQRECPNGGKRWQEVDAQRQVNFPVIEKVVRVVVGASTPQPPAKSRSCADGHSRLPRVGGGAREESASRCGRECRNLIMRWSADLCESLGLRQVRAG